MVKSPKKSLKWKTKRQLTELELNNHANTEPSVSADYNLLKKKQIIKNINKLAKLI